MIRHFGQIDILINNAGISQRSLVRDTLYKVDLRLMNVNFLGTITLSKTVLQVNKFVHVFLSNLHCLISILLNGKEDILLL